MTDPVNAEDDLVVGLKLCLELHRAGEALSGYKVSHVEVPARDLEKLFAALEAVRSTRDGEIERLREALARIARMNDLSEAASADGLEAAARSGLYECELIASQALNQGTDNVG